MNAKSGGNHKDPTENVEYFQGVVLIDDNGISEGSIQLIKREDLVAVLINEMDI